jgi:predicted Zn-dependent peptidase
VEHMVFKGTTSRSAKQIAREVDTIGGNLDAFTGKEMVCFNIKVLDENVAPALDVLADLVLHPTFTPEDLAREQGVILEEIKMDEDNPDYLVHEVWTQNFWKNEALGRPILGTKKTVSSFNQQIVFDFYASRFTPRNMVFSAAGNLPRCSRAPGQSPRPLRDLSAEHHAGRRHELAPLPDHPRRPGAGLRHLLGDESLPRHRLALHLRRHGGR